jgi:integrase
MTKSRVPCVRRASFIQKSVRYRSGPLPSSKVALAGRGVDTRTLQAFMGHRSIANTVIYTAVADKRVRNIWGK